MKANGLREPKRRGRPNWTSRLICHKLKVVAGVGGGHTRHTFAQKILCKQEFGLDGLLKHGGDAFAQFSVEKFWFFAAHRVDHLEGEVHVH